MKVYELERLLSQVKNKEAEVMIGFVAANYDYTDAEITAIDARSTANIVFIEAREV